jgi:CheY-like chemotaxis protein
LIPSAARRRLVLCVDDNAEVLQSLRRQLRGAVDDLRIELASDAAHALDRLEVLAPRPGESVVIVSDWLMPGMRGEALIEAIHARWGPLRTVVLSGHIDPDARTRLEAMPAVACVLPKPWDAQTLVDQVRGLLDAPPLQ